MFALDIIRYNGSTLSQFMGPYFNSRQMPSFSVVSNPSFSVLSYGIALSTFTTLFSFLLHDPFPNRGLGAVSPDEVNHVTTGLSLSYAVFPSPFRDVTATPSSLFAQSTLDSTISLVGTHTPNHVGTVFTAEVSHTGMAELTAVLTDPLFIHQPALIRTINFKHPSYRWLDAWYAERCGFIGVETEVRRRTRGPSGPAVRRCMWRLEGSFLSTRRFRFGGRSSSTTR